MASAYVLVQKFLVPTKADELLKVVQSWAITMGSVPAFICGDFNLVYKESSVLQSWERRCLFTDLNVHFSGLKQGWHRPPTLLEEELTMFGQTGMACAL